MNILRHLYNRYNKPKEPTMCQQQKNKNDSFRRCRAGTPEASTEDNVLIISAVLQEFDEYILLGHLSISKILVSHKEKGQKEKHETV